MNSSLRRYMGVDFGSKRVGIAFSSEDNMFSLPHTVVENDAALIERIQKMCEERGVTDIVVGESKNYEGKDNVIMKDIRAFIDALKKSRDVVIHLEPEFLTSAEANRVLYRRPDRDAGRTGGRVVREHEMMNSKNPMLDASAAALILKSFLDRQRHE